MERETGLEAATSSLGRRLQIGNEDYCVSCTSFLPVENSPVFTLCFAHAAGKKYLSGVRDPGYVEEPPSAVRAGTRITSG